MYHIYHNLRHYDPSSKGLDINTLITVIAGLGGVLVGAFISYYFNKKLAENTNRARIAIQRKNIIFSKLYKELLNIRRILLELPEESFYFEMYTEAVKTSLTHDGWDTFNLDGKTYDRPSFNVWLDIKNDIRKTQIPLILSNKFEDLQQKIKEYFLNQQAFFEEGRKIEKANNIKMIEIYQKPQLQYNKSVFQIDLYDFFKEPIKIDEIIEEYKKNYHLNDEELITELREILNKITECPSHKKLKGSFDNFKISLDHVLLILDK